MLNDLNRLLARIPDLPALVRKARARPAPRSAPGDAGRLADGMNRLYRLKKSAYEDFRDGLLSRADYLRYKEDYERQERALSAQLEQQKGQAETAPTRRPWIESLLRQGRLTVLDRITVAEAVRQIRIFQDGRIEITYTFSDEPEPQKD